MKKKYTLGLAMVGLSLCATGCNPDVADRTSTTSDKDNPYLSEIVVDRDINKKGQEIKILQFTDIHWNTQTDYQLQQTFMRSCIEKANPDLVVLTGDNMLNATKQLANKANEELHETAKKRHEQAKKGVESIVPIRDENGDFLDKDGHIVTSYKDAAKEKIRPMYFSYTWGNHDKQGSYSRPWLNDLAQSSPYSVYRDPGVWGDEINGEGNCIIDFKVNNKTKAKLGDEEEVAWRVYCVDSHANHNDYGHYGYQNIRPNQIRWLEDQAMDLKEKQGELVPSSEYHHICPWEFAEAFYKDNGAIVKKDKNGNDVENENGTHVYESLGRTFDGVKVGDEVKNRYNFNGKVIGYLGENYWGTKTVSKPTKNEKGEITGKEKIAFGTSGHRSTIIKNGKEESFFDVSARIGVLGMHVGHDHQNDWVTQYEHKNPIDNIKRSMILAYGVKTGRELYYINKKDTDKYNEWPTMPARVKVEDKKDALNGNKYSNGLYNLDFNDTEDHHDLYNTGNGKYKNELIGSSKYFPKPGKPGDDNHTKWGFDHSGATLVTLHPYGKNNVNSEVRGNFDMEHMYIDTLDVQDTIEFARDQENAEIERNKRLFGKWLAQRATNLPNKKYNDIIYTPETIGGEK